MEDCSKSTGKKGEQASLHLESDTESMGIVEVSLSQVPLYTQT